MRRSRLRVTKSVIRELCEDEWEGIPRMKNGTPTALLGSLANRSVLTSPNLSEALAYSHVSTQRVTTMHALRLTCCLSSVLVKLLWDMRRQAPAFG